MYRHFSFNNNPFKFQYDSLIYSFINNYYNYKNKSLVVVNLKFK